MQQIYDEIKAKHNRIPIINAAQAIFWSSVTGPLKRKWDSTWLIKESGMDFQNGVL